MNSNRIAELRALAKYMPDKVLYDGNSSYIGIADVDFDELLTALPEALDEVERLNNEAKVLQAQVSFLKQDATLRTYDGLTNNEEVQELKRLLLHAESKRQELATEKNDEIVRLQKKRDEEVTARLKATMGVSKLRDELTDVKRAFMECQSEVQRMFDNEKAKLRAELEAMPDNRWREKYYDKVTELNKADADLAVAVEALKKIANEDLQFDNRPEDKLFMLGYFQTIAKKALNET